MPEAWGKEEMGRPRRGENARLIGAFRRDRGALLVTTALTAAVVTLLALPARGQVAPDTQPAGGVVVAGSARIAATPTTTTVTQSSGRAAVNWQSFNVGSGATVDFVQPSANAVTLNRVMAADPSQIAGHIQANGGIVITNPAGVVFVRGSEVNAASVLVSAPGITNRNFMAGRMQFDISPKPGARIVNAGQITVKSAGLAALVAPEVVNSGVITAKLGHVILAGGAAAETLDLYGDGLVSLDVTPEAHATRLANGAAATALTTNTGTIIASGGTVELTASQVDGLVQNLVDAGGTIAADSVGTHSGTIAITGIGGSIRIPGTLLAEGKAPGTSGGAIALDATGSVTLTRSATVDASGSAGGGTVAIGTTLARARGGPGTAATLTANSVSIAPRARIAASATDDGDGGRVTVLSLGDTAMSGTIQARGGRFGGNGGSVEISGENLSLSGGVDVGAPLGVTGSILLDPTNLTIVDSGADDSTDVGPNGVTYDAGGADDTVSASAIEGLTGSITLQATNSLEIAASISLGAGKSLTLEAGNNLTIDAEDPTTGSVVVVSAPGDIEIDAATSIATGGLSVLGTVMSTAGNLSLSAGTGGISIPGSISGDAVSFDTTGPVNDSGGSITATTLSGTSTGASLTGSNNVGTLATFNSSSGGTFDLENQSSLTVTGQVTVPSGSSLEIGADSLTLATGSSLVAPGGNVVLNGGAGSIVINGGIGGSPEPALLTLTADGPIFGKGGTLDATTLSGSSAGASLTNINNSVSTLAGFDSSTGGTFNLEDKSPLTITGQVIVPSGSFLAIEADTLSVNGGALQAPNGTVQLAPYSSANAVTLIESGTVGAGTLAITKADLEGVSASVLQIGTSGGGPIIIGNSGDNITIPTATLNLVSSLGVTEPGALSVGELIGDVGSATLDSTSNSVGALGNFSDSSGGFSLTEDKGQVLLVAGDVSVPSGQAIALTADGIAVGAAGSLIASGGTVTLASAKSGLALDLTTGSAVASDGTFSLGDTTPNTAAINTGSTGTLVIGTSTGGAITISGAIGMPGVDLLDLLSGGALSETMADSLNVGTLAANVASATLIGTLNVIGTLEAVTATGGFSLTDTENLALAGLLKADTNTVQLIDPGFAITESGGRITAGTLTGSAASAVLTDANNVGTLGAFAASSGGFSLVEAQGQALLVTDIVSVPSGQTIALTADGIALGSGGSLSAAGATVTLAPATSGLALDVTTGLASAQPGTFSLGDTTPNTAAISAGTVVVSNVLVGAGNDGAITVSGSIALPATTDLDILSGGALSETTADSLSVGTLAADVQSASLIGNNAIGTLDAVAATGGFSLTDTEDLTLAGLLKTDTNTVQLNDPGFAITEQGGSITAGTLTGSAASATFADANNIGALGAFAVSESGFTLAEAAGQDLLVTGVVSVPGGQVLALTADGLAIGPTGSLSAAGATVTLAAATPGLALDLTTGAGVASLGTFSLGPTAGSAAATAGTLTIGTNTGGAITISGAIGMPDIGLLDLMSNATTGIVSEGTADSLSVGTLAADVASASLIGNNGIGTLGNVSATGGGFSLVEAAGQMLSVTGAVSVPVGQTIALTMDGFGILGGSLNAAGGTVKLTPASANLPIALIGSGKGSANTLSINDPDLGLISASTLQIGSATAGAILIGNPGDLITVPGVTMLLLESASDVTENGALSITELRGAVASATLDSTANTIAVLGGFSNSSGGFSLAETQGQALLVSGAVSVPNGNTIALTADGIALGSSGSLMATGGTVALASAGSGLALDLVTGLGAASVGTFSLGDASPDTAAISAGTVIIGDANGGAITITGPIDMPDIGLLDLLSGGAVSETTATDNFSVGTLAANVASANLIGNNHVGTLDDITASGGFTLTDANGLAISGVVDTGAGAIDLTAGGSIAEIGSGTLIGAELLGFAGGGTAAGTAGVASFANTNTLASLGNFTALGGFTLADAGDLALIGALDARVANVVLTGGATVTEPSGSITATTLSGTLASAALDGANSITDLANFSAAGGFSLTDLEPLTLTGPVSAGSGEAAFTLGGSLVQTTVGVLTAGTLAGSASLIDLTDPTNQIASLSAISAPGGLTITTATDLAIGGLVNTSSAPVVLKVGGAIDEIPGGTVSGGALTGSASAASFANINTIGELGNFTAPGGFTFDNAGDLPIAGLLDAGPATASLVAGGSLFETTATLLGETTAGAITAGTLTGSAGSVTLGATANLIADLGSFSAGAFDLTDGENLAVAGAVAGDPINLVVNGNLAIGGAAGAGMLTSAGPVFLTVSGAITEPNGAIDAASLSGSSASASLGGANQVPVLGVFSSTGSFLFNADEPTLTVNGPVSAGSASLASTGSLVLAGLVSSGSATLSAGGSISEPGGAISAGTLAGAAASAALTATNTIDTLGSFSTSGTFLLADSAPLAVAGPVSAPFLGISDPASISFTGSTNVGTLSVTAGGSITEPGGIVVASLLEGSAAGLAQFGPDAPAGSASITTLGPFSVAAGSFTLTDSLPLVITGPLDANYFAITAPGSIVLSNVTITTLGLPVAEQSATAPTRPGSFFSVTTPGGRFLELGRTTIDPGGGTNTVRIQLNPAGGLISFADLVAPNTTLILDTGAGTAVGTIDLGALIVIGNLGSSTLDGTVANLSGLVASSKATISPFQSPRYRLNSCPLMSVNCIFIAPEQVPQGNPLSNIAIVSAPPTRREIDLLLPNVAAQDY